MRGRLAVLLPALLFAALHLRTLDYGFAWVDEAEIGAGTILRPPGEILAAFGQPLHRAQGFGTETFSQPYYRPFQVVTASALDAAFGRTPRTFRALSLALGALTASLFAALALTLFGDARAALFAGALFAVHPALLEIYVWIAGLSAAWMGFFVVASLLAGLRAERPACFAFSLAALGLGLLSKENAAVVPALQVALLLALGPRLASVRASALLVAAQAVLVALHLLVLRPAVLGTAGTGAPPIGGSLVAQWQTSLAQWPSQLLWLFAPIHSTTSDAVRVVTHWSDPATLAGAALALGSAALCIVWFVRGHALAAASLAWLWLAFLPTSGLAPLLHARAERNLFLPLFGAALLQACALRALLRTRAPRAAVIGVAAVLVLALAQRSFVRAPDWRSTKTLFERDVAADPRHREGRVNLIVAALVAGDAQAAKRHADVLASQHPEAEGWHSYTLEPNVRELVCVANAAAGADADTLRRYPPRPLSPSDIWLAAGFHACYAGALERMNDCKDALPIYKALHRGSGDPRFAEGAARCEAKLGS
jgi:protein O-mannosyl-transferase